MGDYTGWFPRCPSPLTNFDWISKSIKIFVYNFSDISATILHIPRQLCSLCVCKISLWSDQVSLHHRNENFHWNDPKCTSAPRLQVAQRFSNVKLEALMCSVWSASNNYKEQIFGDSKCITTHITALQLVKRSPKDMSWLSGRGRLF